jgi:hypothetical protein
MNHLSHFSRNGFLTGLLNQKTKNNLPLVVRFFYSYAGAIISTLSINPPDPELRSPSQLVSSQNISITKKHVE